MQSLRTLPRRYTLQIGQDLEEFSRDEHIELLNLTNDSFRVWLEGGRPKLATSMKRAVTRRKAQLAASSRTSGPTMTDTPKTEPWWQLWD